MVERITNNFTKNVKSNHIRIIYFARIHFFFSPLIPSLGSWVSFSLVIPVDGLGVNGNQPSKLPGLANLCLTVCSISFCQEGQPHQVKCHTFYSLMRHSEILLIVEDNTLHLRKHSVHEKIQSLVS